MLPLLLLSVYLVSFHGIFPLKLERAFGDPLGSRKRGALPQGWGADLGGGVFFVYPGFGGVGCYSVFLLRGELLCHPLPQLASLEPLGVKDDCRVASLDEVPRSLRDAISRLLEQLCPSGPPAQ